MLEFETKMAAVSLKMVERRDPVKTYNKRTVAEIKLLSANIGWDTFFSGIGILNFGDVVIESPTYFSALSELLAQVPISSIKSYLKFHILSSSAPYLSKVFVDEHFNFYKKTLNGIPENEPRWKRILSVVSSTLSDPVSKKYVEKHFSKEAKDSANEMVQYIILAFKERINAAPWMQAVTKQKALDKVANFKAKIGFPDKWNDFTPLDGKLSRKNAYLSNIRIANTFVFQMDELDRINKDVDKTKWEMAPFMVNAYFHPTMNEIVFPVSTLLL